MGAIYIMWLRELKRYFRSKAQIVVSLGQPTLYLLALGFGFGPVFAKAGGGNYIQFMAPGVIGMTVLFSSIFSGMAMLWDRQFGFLKETLVAPVPRFNIIFGRTLGGATVASLQGFLMLIVCLIAGFRPTHGMGGVHNWLALPVAAIFVVMIAIVFAALGSSLGSTIKDMQGFQMLMNFLVLPIFFLSGALYPLSNLGRVMTWITACRSPCLRHRRPARRADRRLAVQLHPASQFPARFQPARRPRSHFPGHQRLFVFAD